MKFIAVFFFPWCISVGRVTVAGVPSARRSSSNLPSTGLLHAFASVISEQWHVLQPRWNYAHHALQCIPNHSLMKSIQMALITTFSKTLLISPKVLISQGFDRRQPAPGGLKSSRFENVCVCVNVCVCFSPGSPTPLFSSRRWWLPVQSVPKRRNLHRWNQLLCLPLSAQLRGSYVRER